MTPQQFLAHIKQSETAAAYLFLGPEPYQREYCRRALIERVFKDSGQREGGVTRYDLDEVTLDTVIEDARSLSLFTDHRIIIAANAEGALPRGKAAAADEDAPAKGSASALAAYLKDPVPGTVLVFEAGRYDFQGEDKKKIERVRTFYADVPAVVEFPQLSLDRARSFAQNLARRAGLDLGAAELDLLVESLGGEAARIAAEIDKLALYASSGRPVGVAEIAELVPEARGSSIFALVGALGRNNRQQALDILDTLIRQGEYLPLALSLLATQFRLALMAKEAGLRSAQQVQTHFSRSGMPMWPSRAGQVWETVSAFSPAQLSQALKLIYSADKALRDIRPDDRVVMEDFILRLTA
jgi:DNA polymerase-3 subunit delta